MKKDYPTYLVNTQVPAECLRHDFASNRSPYYVEVRHVFLGVFSESDEPMVSTTIHNISTHTLWAIDWAKLATILDEQGRNYFVNLMKQDDVQVQEQELPSTEEPVQQQ